MVVAGGGSSGGGDAHAFLLFFFFVIYCDGCLLFPGTLRLKTTRSKV